jgi:hypothetical protein
MSSVTILTDDNEIVIIPRLRYSAGLNCSAAQAATNQPVYGSMGGAGFGETAENEVPTTGWEKVRADGAVISATDPTTEHVAVISYDTGLMWAVESIGDEDGDSQDHAACTRACADLRLLGHDDWRLPTRAELAALVDDTRTDPAIDPNLFPRVKPNWHWTSTAYAGSSGSAWLVGFDGGYVLSNPRYYHGGFALAVRRAGQ